MDGDGHRLNKMCISFMLLLLILLSIFLSAEHAVLFQHKNGSRKKQTYLNIRKLNKKN